MDYKAVFGVVGSSATAKIPLGAQVPAGDRLPGGAHARIPLLLGGGFRPRNAAQEQQRMCEFQRCRVSEAAC